MGGASGLNRKTKDTGLELTRLESHRDDSFAKALDELYPEPCEGGETTRAIWCRFQAILPAATSERSAYDAWQRTKAEGTPPIWRSGKMRLSSTETNGYY